MWTGRSQSHARLVGSCRTSERAGMPPRMQVATGTELRRGRAGGGRPPNLVATEAQACAPELAAEANVERHVRIVRVHVQPKVLPNLTCAILSRRLHTLTVRLKTRLALALARTHARPPARPHARTHARSRPHAPL